MAAAMTSRAAWNYLRVRGEYAIDEAAQRLREELPPRARRIHTIDYLLRYIIGTTSACAENTRFRPETHRRNRNYLRVRGEYSCQKFRVSHT